MIELHYSIKKKNDAMRYHGTFRHRGEIDKDSVRPGLTAAIREKWNFPHNVIESVECYYYKDGEEVTVK